MTLPVVKEQIKSITQDVADHEVRIRVIEKHLFWGSLFFVLMGMAVGLIGPIILKKMGLG